MRLKYYPNYKEYLNNFLDITSFEFALSTKDDNQEIAKNWVKDKNNWLKQVGDYLTAPRKDETPQQKEARETLAQSFTQYTNTLLNMKAKADPNAEMTADEWESMTQELGKASVLKENLEKYFEASNFKKMEDPAMQATIAAINSFERGQKYYERMASFKLAQEIKEEEKQISNTDDNIRQNIINFANDCKDLNLYAPQLEAFNEKVNKVLHEDDDYIENFRNVKENHAHRSEEYRNYDKNTCEVDRAILEMQKIKKNIVINKQKNAEVKKLIKFMNNPFNKSKYERVKEEKKQLAQTIKDIKSLSGKLDKWLQDPKNHRDVSEQIFKIDYQRPQTGSPKEQREAYKAAFMAWRKEFTPEKQQQIINDLYAKYKQACEDYETIEERNPVYVEYAKGLKTDLTSSSIEDRNKQSDRARERYLKYRESIIKLHDEHILKTVVTDLLDKIEHQDVSLLDEQYLETAEKELSEREKKANPQALDNAGTKYFKAVLEQDEKFEKNILKTSKDVQALKTFVDGKINEKTAIKNQIASINSRANELSQRCEEFKANKENIQQKINAQISKMHDKFSLCKQKHHKNSAEYTHINDAINEYLANPTKDSLANIGLKAQAYLDAKNKEFRITKSRSQMGAFRLQYAQDLVNISKDGILDFEQIERDGQVIDQLKEKLDNRVMGKDSLDTKLAIVQNDNSAIMNEKLDILAKDKRSTIARVKFDGVHELTKLADEYKHAKREPGERYLSDPDLMLDNQVANIRSEAPQENMKRSEHTNFMGN